MSCPRHTRFPTDVRNSRSEKGRGVLCVHNPLCKHCAVSPNWKRTVRCSDMYQIKKAKLAVVFLHERTFWMNLELTRYSTMKRRLVMQCWGGMDESVFIRFMNKSKIVGSGNAVCTCTCVSKRHSKVQSFFLIKDFSVIMAELLNKLQW